MEPEGFWTGRGTPATVDWCEPNYVHSFFVAEWFNSLSSLPIALLGVWAIVWTLRTPWRRAGRFVFAATVLAIVGVGSTAFHATLLRWGQALDELAMVYAGLAYLYVLWARRGAVARGRGALALFGLAFTLAYFFWQQWFLFFVGAYAGLVALLVVRTGFVTFRLNRTTKGQWWFALAAGSYVGGVLFLWIPEHVLLPCDHPLQAWHLHAWFHVTSAIGSYAWLEWAASDQGSFLREAPRK